MNRFTLYLFTSACLLLGCGGSDNEEEKQFIVETFDFSESLGGVSADTANHRVNPSEEIFSGLVDLPSPFEFRKGVVFQWRSNNSSSNKGFVKSFITDLNPNSDFRVSFAVNVLSNIPTGCPGIGASPGEGTLVHAKLSLEEPLKLIEPDSGGEDSFFINIDKDPSLDNGRVLLGNFALPIPCDGGPYDWEMKSVSNDDEFIFTSNASGEAWIYVAIDVYGNFSAELYITEIEITLQEI